MKAQRINFAERQFINRKIPTAIMVTLGALAVSGLLLNILLTLWNGGEYFKQRRILKSQSEDHSTLQQRLSDADKELYSKDTPLLTAEAMYIKSILDKKRFSWSEFLDRIEEVKPYQALIEDVNPKMMEDGNLYVKIKGQAKPREEIFKFEENIYNAKFFAKPKLVREDVDKQSSWNNYELECIYLPGGKK